MSPDQLRDLRKTAVTVRYGIIVTDKYGADHPLPPKIDIHTVQWLYGLGLRGVSPELGAAALECVVQNGGTVETGPEPKCTL